MSILSLRLSDAKYWFPPPNITSKSNLRYSSAIDSMLPRLFELTQKPAGVAWVMATVVTQPAIFPDCLNFCQIGRNSSPFAATFSDPLGTRTPPPHAEL